MQANGAADGPVYVLGAGFSRAINSAMPLTDELGDAVTERLHFQWPEGTEKVTFEERLTLLSTALPFLQGFENTGRRAQAEELTATLGQVLDERNSVAAKGTAPLWLLQLVSLWHAQKAVVITFNYDTLVERAVTVRRPARIVQPDLTPSGLHGWQVVYPSPSPVNIHTYGDSDGPTLGSFQLLKLHGSLNWYWATGDPSTLVRDASRRGFGNEIPEGKDVAGVRLLDRFLVPPVTSKDGYYGINLVHLLWRAAFEAVTAAPRLAILGYSMPPADRIAAELLRGVSQETPVDLVNRKLGPEGKPSTPLGRARDLGFDVDGRWEGADAVPRYVADALDRASASMPSEPIWNANPGATAVVTFRFGEETRAAVLRDSDAGVVTADLDWHNAARSDMPPYEYALNNALPRGTAHVGDFYTAKRIGAAVADGSPFEFTRNKETFRVVGVEIGAVGRWSVVHLQTAPMS